jgi:hypothetical protein
MWTLPLSRPWIFQWCSLPEQQERVFNVEVTRRRLLQVLTSGPVFRGLAPLSLLPRTQQVSFSVLPHPRQWDDAWLERLSAMTSGDWHGLVLDYVPQVAMLLMPAKAWGPSSPAYLKLTELLYKVQDIFFNLRMLFSQVRLCLFVCLRVCVYPGVDREHSYADMH